MSDRRERNKEQTIQDVLIAATSLFSKNGLHGTSIRDIQNASGVSKGLIMHHFGTKENLYAAVQDNLKLKYITWMADQRDASRDLLDSIETGIRSALTYQKSNKDFRRISMWSNLEGQQWTTDLDKRFTASLIQAMQTAQKEGLVRNDVEAFILPFIIRGAIDYWIRGEDLRKELVEEDQDEKEISDKDFINVMLKLILNASA
ncbi:MAG: TetR/AcrR family transcriptional regulator [Anaerolineales bacterium]